jgi:hypothetical protein
MLHHNSGRACALACACTLLFSTNILAQRAAVRRQVEKNIEKKVAEPYREKGKSEINKVTYENDKRYKDAKNATQAELSFEVTIRNKKGAVKNVNKERIVFGATGECYVMDEGSKNETWWIYDYAAKANYMVFLKDKSAMKMPLINMQKMMERAVDKAANNKDGNNITVKATDQIESISGFKCRKFIFTYPDDNKYKTMEAWYTDESILDLKHNYVMGARLGSYKFPSNPEFKDFANSFMVKSVLYDKKDVAVYEKVLKSASKTVDPKYFDMSAFKINDVLNQL